MTATLERIDLSKIDSEETAFAVEVQAQLGYDQLAVSVLPGKDLEVFRTVGVMPFVQASVDAYKEEAQRKAADPFLVVRLTPKGKAYYVEVWNEPAFKGERTV